MKYNISLTQEKKVIAASIALVTLVNLGAAGMWLYENNSDKKEELTHLARPGFGEGETVEEILVTKGKETQKITLKVGEKEYTEQEAEKLLEEQKSELETLILGKNKSFDKVEYPLELLSSYPDSPVQMSWSTDASDVLSWDGKIGTDVSEKGTQVTLGCELYLGEKTKSWERKVTVWPEKVSAEERLQREIQRAADNQNSSSDQVELPDNIRGNPVKYTREKENTSMTLAFFGTLAGALIYPIWRAREKEKADTKRALLQADYPDLVSKILLFLQAGLTVRNSVEKIVKDYLAVCKKNKKRRRPAYEELTAAFHELEGGMPESRVYERFGSRCGTPEYKVLSVLLTQNLKKGNQGVLTLLKREAAASMEERKRNAKVQGEQASTKLLAPMFIQLSIVLALLMIPAFLSFY